jgi:hypothetical protein
MIAQTTEVVVTTAEVETTVEANAKSAADNKKNIN